MKIPDDTKVQSIDLTVKDLNAALNFYSDLLGFRVIEKSANTVALSANGKAPYIIKLIEDINAQINYKGAPGLYHLAIRFPDRKELARVFLRLFKNNTKFQGFSDHLVSEAIYLSDPEGNGVELYADRPKEEWEWKFGEVLMESL
ncbi:MAG: VOC family protein, partial [Ignavibacteria bacterium]